MAFRCLKDIKFGGAGNEYYGIFEVNNMTAQEVRTKGSLPLEINDFMDAERVILPCEQGMLLVYDESAGVVRKAKNVNEKVMIHNSEYKLYDARETLKDFALWPQEGAIQNIKRYKIDDYGKLILGADGQPQPDSDLVVKFYDDKTPFPRMFTPYTNDIYTTNTVIFNDADFAETATSTSFDAIAAEIKNGNVFATVAVENAETGISKRWAGYHQLVKVTNGTPPTATNVFKAVKAYDLPDGQPAIRFEVWN